jgi:hypothetical protein
MYILQLTQTTEFLRSVYTRDLKLCYQWIAMILVLPGYELIEGFAQLLHVACDPTVAVK